MVKNITKIGQQETKQAVGGRPPRYAPAQACNASAQWQP